MPVYETLRLMSFRLRPTALEPVRYWRVAFPERWKEMIRGLAMTKADRPRSESSVPIDSLNRALRALVPNIVDIDAQAGRAGSTGWITAQDAIPLWALQQIARTWVQVHYGEVGGVESVLSQMEEGDLEGAFEELPVTIGAGRGGTAEFDRRLFTLLPNRVAGCLSTRGAWEQPGQSPRELVRVVGGQDARAEVMTWNPYSYLHADGDWRFSTVLRFSLQTIPFDPNPVVNVEMIARRWLRAAANGKYFLGSGWRTVYVRPSRRWFDDGPPECFHVVPIGNARKPGVESGWGLEWKSELGPLFSRLEWPRSPEIGSLERDPASAIDSDPAMAVVFDTGMGPSHRVTAGFMPGDRRPMFEQLAERLSDVLEPVSLLERSEPRLPRVSRPSVSMRPRPDEERARRDWEAERENLREQAEARARVPRIAADGLRVGILHQDTRALGALHGALTELLGVEPEASGDATRWGFGDRSITVTARRLGAVGDALRVTRGCRQAELRQAIAHRAREMAAFLAGGPAGSGLIVELQGADGFESREQDPKSALRKGAALAGLVTQFITPPVVDGDAEEPGSDASLAHRARAAWLDLFRQLGSTSRLDFSPVGQPLPANLQYVGLWFHNSPEQPGRAQVRLPVLVRLTADGQPPLAAVGTPEIRGWQPYHEVLARLGGLPALAFHEYGRDTVAHFLRDSLEEHLLPGGPVLLMSSAQNIRQTWRWMQDGQLELDQLHLPPGRPRPVSDWAGLRVARVRTEERGETPECYAERAEEMGFSKGLWQRGERNYASTGAKPAAMSTLTPAQSKFRSYSTRKGDRDAAPRQLAWNPTCLEIAPVALQPGDDPLVWANAVHQLRFAATHFSDSLVLPLPLHLASQMDEYILPLERR